jgi:hypothetical protein
MGVNLNHLQYFNFWGVFLSWDRGLLFAFLTAQ